jgi:hypothetical protein
MFKNKKNPRNYRKCPVCQHLHDGSLDECPRCGQQSDGPVLTTRFPNVIRVHWIKQIFLFLIGWGGLNVVSLIVSAFFVLYADNYIFGAIQRETFLSSHHVGIMLNLITYSTLFVGILGLLWKDLLTILKTFKRLRAIVVGLAYGGAVMASVIIYNLIVILAGVEMSDNQNETAIVTMMTSYPVMSFVAFVILGPLVEEMTYRLGLFSLLHRLNRPLAYVVTMLIFGLIHVSFNAETIVNELINLPSYIIAGTILTIAYEKEGFAVSTYAHITNNLISFLLTAFQG